MATKRLHKHSRQNKTKKNKFIGNVVPQSIGDVYIKNDSHINNEKKLACFLVNNAKIKHFAFSIFYYMLSYWKHNIKRNWSVIIKHSLIEHIEGNDVLKIGFSESEYISIIKFINKREEKELLAYLDDKFLKTTAALNSLSEPEYTIYHVDFNKKLQKTFIAELENIMMIKSIKWKDIKNMYMSLTNTKYKILFQSFIFDILYGADKSINSIFRHNLNNLNFFREKLNAFKHDKTNYTQINVCNKSIIAKNEAYLKYGIYNVAEKYKIGSNLPYHKIMKSLNARVIGGPSGSTSILYIMLFHFYMYPFTYKNKILLLGTVIADYVPLWHTIPEILLSAYPEFKDANIPRYTLEQNSTAYCVHLLKPFI